MKKMVGLLFLVSLSQIVLAGQGYSQPEESSSASDDKRVACSFCKKMSQHYAECPNRHCDGITCLACENEMCAQKDLHYSEKEGKFLIFASCKKCRKERRIYGNKKGSLGQIYIHSRALIGSVDSHNVIGVVTD